MNVQVPSERPGGRRARGDGGAAIVELALLLPFLAVVVFGTVDLGRAYQMQNRLTNAAREGAFYGQYRPCDGNGIESAADDEDPGLADEPGWDVTASATGCPNPAGGSDLEVEASVEMEVLTPLVSAFTGPSVTVTGRSTVVVQG